MDLSSDIVKRRTFLTGAGVALLLPRLESLGQVTDAESPRRLLTIVNHLSFYQPELIPEAAGAFDQPPPSKESALRRGPNVEFPCTPFQSSELQR